MRLTEITIIDLTHYRNFLSGKAFHVINTALEDAKKTNYQYLGGEHIFLSYACVESFFNVVLAELNLDPANIIDFVKDHQCVPQTAIGVKMKIPSAKKTSHLFRKRLFCNRCLPATLIDQDIFRI